MRLLNNLFMVVSFLILLVLGDISRKNPSRPHFKLRFFGHCNQNYLFKLQYNALQFCNSGQEIDEAIRGLRTTCTNTEYSEHLHLVLKSCSKAGINLDLESKLSAIDLSHVISSTESQIPTLTQDLELRQAVTEPRDTISQSSLAGPGNEKLMPIPSYTLTAIDLPPASPPSQSGSNKNLPVILCVILGTCFLSLAAWYWIHVRKVRRDKNIRRSSLELGELPTSVKSTVSFNGKPSSLKSSVEAPVADSSFQNQRNRPLCDGPLLSAVFPSGVEDRCALTVRSDMHDLPHTAAKATPKK